MYTVLSSTRLLYPVLFLDTLFSVLEEDASTALRTFPNRYLKGKQLQVSRARKPGEKPAKENTSEEKPSSNQRKQRETKQEGREDRRSVIVFGLPENFDGKTLRKRVRKLGNLERFEWPERGIGRREGSKCVARASFRSRQECLEATKKLDRHQIHVSLLQNTSFCCCYYKCRHLTAQGYTMRARHADEVLKDTEGRDSARLIIRNLPFQVCPISALVFQ